MNKLKNNRKLLIIIGTVLFIVIAGLLVFLLSRKSAPITESETTQETQEITSQTHELSMEAPEKLSKNEKDTFSVKLKLTSIGDAVYPSASFSIGFNSDKLEFVGVSDAIFPKCDVNVKHSNETGTINIMYLDMDGEKTIFTNELLGESDNVILLLNFCFRDGINAGDTLEFTFKDAIFAASDESESLSIKSGNLVTSKSSICIEDSAPVINSISSVKSTPKPVEPETQKVDEKKTYACSFYIECSTILNNLNDFNQDKFSLLPANGVIFPKQSVTFYDGESVFDVLNRICRENGIHMESSWTPIYNSAYIEGIHNLYEFDCGSGSGWMYRVNGWYPNYGCSRYQLADGDAVEWKYTCDLGEDIQGGYATK